jgi:Na+-driven multidrug efflux pump
MKYFVRRLLTGIVIVPLTGFAYAVMCVLAIAWGAGQNNSVAGYFEIGCWFGVGLTLVFAIDAFRKG